MRASVCFGLLLFAAPVLAACPLVDTPRVLLAANFDNLTIGQPIGTGGPAAGEPISVAAQIITEIVANQPPPGAFVRLTRENSPDVTSAASMRFEFLDGEEITGGALRIDLRFRALDLGSFYIRTREQGLSTTAWVDLETNASGNWLRRVQNASVAPIIGTYQVDTWQSLSIIADFDSREFCVRIDDEVVASGSWDSRDRGVGSMIFGFMAGSANFDKSFEIDELLVTTLSTKIFQDRFE